MTFGIFDLMLRVMFLRGGEGEREREGEPEKVEAFLHWGIGNTEA